MPLAITRFGDRLYANVERKVTQHLSEVAQASKPCRSSSGPCRAFVHGCSRRQVLLQIQVGGASFLRDVIEQWNEHTKSMQVIRDILMASLTVDQGRGRGLAVAA